MKDKKLAVFVIGLIALFAIGTAAQHHPEQTAPSRRPNRKPPRAG